MTKWILFAAVTLSTFGLASCNSADEQDNLAKAQKCLDEVPQSNPSEADTCLEYVEKYTSQQANIIKCAIYVVSGGLMENRILKGYQVYKDDSITHKEAAFMAVLSLDNPDVTTGLTKAQTANTYCQASGVPGLKYLANIIVTGTAMAKSLAAFGTPITGSSSTTDIKNAVNNFLTDCTGSTPSTNCPSDADLAIMGNSIASLSVSYCANENADDDVCDKVDQAMTAAGNNATYVGQALLCYMNNKTFNSGTGDCN